MATELYVPRVIVGSARWLPPVAGTTLQWDGNSGVCHAVQVQAVSEHVPPSLFRLRRASATATRTPPYWTMGEIDLAPDVLLEAIAWEQEATHLTFALNPVLLGDPAQGVLPKATGALVWRPWQAQTASPTPAVSPVLHGRVPSERDVGEPVTIIPCLHVGDPLLTHIALVLQSACKAKDKAEQLYTETLATALVDHFLRRYAATRGAHQDQDARRGGLAPHTLQRMLTYIQAHLDQRLSLMTLANVAQMSPSHFAHLFKRSTGLAPHKYVTVRRIEYAKQLLAETVLPIIEIGYRVGCADSSHFSALFR